MPTIHIIRYKFKLGRYAICFCRNWFWRTDLGHYGYIYIRDF